MGGRGSSRRGGGGGGKKEPVMRYDQTTEHVREIRDRNERWAAIEKDIEGSGIDATPQEIDGVVQAWIASSTSVREVQQNPDMFAKATDIGSINQVRREQVMEAYIAAAPKYKEPFINELYRGMTVREADVGNTFKVGGELDMRGTSSWTSSKYVAEAFTEGGSHRDAPVLFRSNNVKSGVSISKFVYKEREVVVSKRAKFVIQQVSKYTFDSGVQGYVIDIGEI